MHRLKGDPSEKKFMHEIMERSGQNLLECLQCGKCSGSCPVTGNEVSGPRQLIAEILCGMRQQALTNSTWWYCVSCGTCMTRCPVEINVYNVATVLCEMAEEEGVAPSEPAIHRFEQMFLRSVEKYGRVKELRTVALYNMLSGHPFKDADKAVKLVLKGAMSPTEMLKGWDKCEETSRLFSRVKHAGHGG